MSVNIEKLDAELRTAGIPIDGVSNTTSPRIDFRPEATQAQRDQAASILTAHDPALTREQALRAEGLDLTILTAVLAVRQSTSWLTVPLAARTRIQGVIDAAAARVVARFS